MTSFHYPDIRRLALLIAAAALTGCAGMDSTENQSGHIRITSEPAGAMAYADGAELGATPVTIVPSDHFRSGFVGFSYRYTGKLSLKRSGCDTWSSEVNDAILSRDIHAKLKCDPNSQAPAAAAPVKSSPSADPAIERLQRIETLHQKELISDEEYKQSRARIIEKL